MTRLARNGSLAPKLVPAAAASLLSAVGCGGAAPRAQDDPTMVVTHHAAGGEAGGEAHMSVRGTVGGMDKRAVQAAFGRTFGPIEDCIRSSRKRLPYLGGDISIFVAVGGMGKASEVYLSRSTLGDDATERCIIGVLQAERWPRPVGGERGEATQSYSFDAPVVEPPHAWSSEQLREAMARDAEPGESPYDELRGKLDTCRKSAGAAALEVTLYLDEDGMPQSVGVGGEGERVRGAAGCIATVVQTTSFPAPGAFFVKTSVGVP